MLSIELIRRDPDMVRQALARRGEADALAPILELDAQRRQAASEGDELRSRRNQVSRQIGEARRSGQEAPEAVREEMRRIGERIAQLEQRVKELEEQQQARLLMLPNLPRADVPDGLTSDDNVVARTWKEPRQFSFTPLPHWDLNEKLGIIDFQRGVKLAGSRFYVTVGYGPRLERALIAWMLDLHIKEHGYTELGLPALCKEEVLVGSGNLPKFADNLYRDAEEDLWLIPTAEVPITNLYRDEILPPGMLPLYYVAQTPCFRREKTAAGRDTRGIKRVHQFNKVEMYKFVPPETSDDELERLVGNAEDICQRLDLPYRVLRLCAGDMGFPSAKSYDIEIWAPGCQEWLEVSSCSNCADFQARRANIRFRAEAGGRPLFAHTLNGSGLALPRVIISILENYQQPDGSVVIPEVLRPYTGFDIIPARSA